MSKTRFKFQCYSHSDAQIETLSKYIKQLDTQHNSVLIQAFQKSNKAIDCDQYFFHQGKIASYYDLESVLLTCCPQFIFQQYIDEGEEALALALLPKIDITSTLNNQPLVNYALDNGAYDLALALLQAGGKVNDTASTEEPILFQAIDADHPELVTALLKSNINPNQDFEQMVALSILTDQLYLIEIAEQLIHHGADINYYSSNYGSILHQFHDHTIMNALLLKLGATNTPPHS